MRGILFTGSVLVIAAAPARAGIPIEGGTPAQQQQLREVLATIPACFLQCADEPVSFNIRRSDDGAAGYGNGVVDVSDVMFGGAAYDRHFKKLQQKEPCLNRQNAAWLEDLRRALVHELTHHVHDTCEGGDQPGGGKLAAFLDLPGGYHDKMKRLQDDERLEKLEDAIDDERFGSPQYCAAQERMVRRVQALGFASRGPGDVHSSSNHGGGEYIAVAIETLAYDPVEFCRSYSVAEIRWLKTNLGDCLGQLENRAPCYDEAEGTTPIEAVKKLNGLVDATRPNATGSGCD